MQEQLQLTSPQLENKNPVETSYTDIRSTLDYLTSEGSVQEYLDDIKDPVYFDGLRTSLYNSEKYLLTRIDKISKGKGNKLDQSRDFQELKLALQNNTEAMESLNREADYNDLKRNYWKNSISLFYSSKDLKVLNLINSLKGPSINKEREFVPEEKINSLIDHQAPSVVIDAWENPILMPVAIINSARGFSSWEEGRPKDSTKNNKSSQETMQDYASQPSEIPAIDITVVVGNNGEINVISENAHRAGAAKLRGKNILIKKITYYKEKS